MNKHIKYSTSQMFGDNVSFNSMGFSVSKPLTCRVYIVMLMTNMHVDT